ncbi:MAG: hypothetical protein K6G10_02670 [Butyrivibrio sp.]|nr:hypothetical protein [Butyrivibrio sp.]
MKKTYILVTLAFDDKSPEAVNIDTEHSIQNDITRLLQGYHRDKLISHYVVADNEVISEKLISEGTKVDISDNRLTAYKIKGVLATRTCNALLRAGLYTAEDLTYVTELQIKQISQIGKAAYEEIQRFCKDYGINIGSNSGKVPSFSKGDIVVSLFDKQYLGYKAGNIPKGTKFEVVEINTRQTDGYFHLPTYLCRLIESDNDMDRAVFYLSQITKFKENYE